MTPTLWNVSTLWSAALLAILAASFEEPCESQEFDQQQVYSPDAVYMPQTAPPDYPHVSHDALERWYDLKYGIRIHWGPYAIWANPGESWALHNMPLAKQGEYHELYKTWNPSAFNADEWTAMMKRDGLKFFVFTTKHHDGFSMYDTKTRVQQRFVYTGPNAGSIEPCDLAYSIMETPLRRDVTRELVDAARRHGIVPGLYFSHIDWYDADFRLDAFNPRRDPEYHRDTDPQAWARFAARHREQVREILTQYGPISELSLDIGFPRGFWPEMEQTVRMARRLQPDCLFRHRGIGAFGDYWTPEQMIPASAFACESYFPWQVIHSLGGKSFSYTADPTTYRSGEWIVSNLVDITAKGGLFMVGVGPDGDGRFHPKAVEAFDYAGRWLKVNGEAIFATRPWIYWKEGDAIRFTRSKDRKFVYAISLQWPGKQLVVKSLRAREGSKLLMLGVEQPLVWRNDDAAGLVIDMPNQLQDEAKRPCQQAYAFRIEAAEPARSQASAGDTPPGEAILPGYASGLEYRYYEGAWESMPTTIASVPVKMGTTGKFDLSAADRKVGYAFDYRGRIRIDQDGDYTFYTTSDAGSRLDVAGKTVVNNDRRKIGGGPHEAKSPSKINFQFSR